MLAKKVGSSVELSEESKRIHYLDAMRSIMMMLGVVYHSAPVFSPVEGVWFIQSDNTTTLAPAIMGFIHIFRMPVFFMISGYFAIFSIQRYGNDLFIKKRLKRILIPLVTTALTVNLAVSLFLFGQDKGMEFFLHKGGWIDHLWFLIALVIYFLLVYIATEILKKEWLHRAWLWIDRLVKRMDLGIMLFLLPLLTMFFYILARSLGFRAFGYNFAVVYEHMPYFLFGLLLFTHPRFLKKIGDFPLKKSLPLFIVSLGMYMFIKKHDCHPFCEFSLNYFKLLTTWIGSFLCFNLFMKLMNRPSTFMFKLADASYTVYLFHPLFVALFATLLVDAGFGGAVGMFILMALVALASYLMHPLLIERIPLLRLLYNGK